MDTEQATILIVEDDPRVRDILRDLLASENYAVETAADGAAGLERLWAGGVDLVLLDLMLPGINGLELCRVMREREGDGDNEVFLPIIMLTALSSQAQRHVGFEAGADDYVTKPFDATELLDRVRVWLRARQRFAAEHARRMTQQARLQELERRALQERIAQDQAVIAMARTASHELRQPLTYIIGALELWGAGRYSPVTNPSLREELHGAATDLAARVDTLSRVVRYEVAEVSGYRMLDLERAQDPDPPTPPPT